MDTQDIKTDLSNLIDNVSPLQHMKDNIISNFDEIKECLQDPKGKGLENLSNAAEKLGNMAQNFSTNQNGYLGSLGEKLADKSNSLKKEGGIGALKDATKKNIGDIKNVANSVKNGDLSAAKSSIKQGIGDAKGSLGNMAKAAGGAAMDVTSGIGGQSGSGRGDQMANELANDAKQLANDAKNVAKGAVAVGRIAAGDISAAKDLMNPEVLKAMLKAAMIAMAIPFIIIAALIVFAVMLIKWLATAIVGAMLKIFEAFNINDIATTLAGAFNPTVYDEWTMEAEYEMIATAFGNDVQEAYDAMMEDIDNQIKTYSENETYNEWEQILEYNKTIGQIDYDKVQSGSSIEDPLENGMPINTPVYIGGYEGNIADSEWGVNGRGSGADPASKKDPNYNKGIYKKDNPNTYATGEEVYFDAAATKEAVKATCGYAAISDMAYIVSGYNVSRYEQPIYNSESGSLSLFDVGLKVLAYKIDIARNIFAQNVDEKGIFGGMLTSIQMLIEDSLGVNTYFSYDPDEIQVVPNSATRRVYEYTEQIYNNVQDFYFLYTYSYVKHSGSCYCPGHGHESSCITESDLCTNKHHLATCVIGCTTEHTHTAACVIGCTTQHDHLSTCKTTNDLCNQTHLCGTGKTHCNCTQNNETGTYTNGPTHQQILNDYTFDSAPTYDPADYKPTVATIAASLGSDCVLNESSISNGTKIMQGNPYSLNRSEYKEVQKTYTCYTLSIPTSPFDCDKLLKAMFEQSPYFKRQIVTSYVTEKDREVTITNDDEIIAAYGGYVWRWKYATKDETIDMGGGITQSLTKDDEIPNGIHAMPYRGSDLYYLYECTGHATGTILTLGFSDIVNIISNKHSFGPDLKCPTCGAKMWETEADDTNSNTIETNRKSTITGIGQYVLTTTDKLVLEDYTGEQTGGNPITPTTVVLEQKNPDGVKITDYYIITVLDRILANKDTVMNALENSEILQAHWASVGNGADDIYGETIDYTPLADYAAEKIIDPSKYNSIVINDGNYMIGIGNWKEDEAIELVASIYMDDPSLLTSLCNSNGITEEDFKSNWTNTSHADATKYKNVVQGLINSSTGKAIQNEKFNEKIENLIEFWRSKGVTDGSTIVFLTTLTTYIPDTESLATGGGAYATFRDYIVSPSIAAGASESLNTAYNGYLAFCNMGNNLGLGDASVKAKAMNLYTNLVNDKENGSFPFLFAGELTPDDVQPLIDNLKLYKTTYHDNIEYWCDAEHRYGKVGNTTIAQLSEMLLGLQNGSVTHLTCDCSSFVAANYYAFGYITPIFANAWLNDTRYQKRTDWDNMLPGDVIRFDGHVEIYIGGGRMIGIGSKERGVSERAIDCFATPRDFYRVVQ